ncbi:MAG: FadD3 family acyl-CoA ligase [Candidatus Brevundimonas phytovorans]|nr:FadD3 family acyl-CoA ligase [Brevundimonas sp.]WEK56776.1 MAG: FadD3 family acyl-CoA ligase [Brevundimonas sp.]
MSSLPLSIPDAARRAAQRWPDATALIEGDQSWTFTALWRDALAFAAACQAMGLGHGDRVAIWAPNSREWILAALGAQTLGCVLVPLNTRFKGAEAADLIRRAGVRVLFTVSEFLGVRYPSLIATEDVPALERIVLLDQLDDFLAAGAEADLDALDAAAARLSPDDLSDIIFTSGTTGAPKGALSAHGQVVAVITGWSERIDLREGDRFLIVNPFFHTFGYKAGWVACLLRGAAIVPMPIFDVEGAASLVEAARITVLPGPPTIYQSLLTLQNTDRRRDLSSLRVAITGAAPVPPVLIERMSRELGMERVVNGYGMTECSVICMSRPEDDAETVSSTCGPPLDGVELCCVDAEGRALPVGEAGEIWVRSALVMRGYLDDPAATAAAIDADGWLHTGDIGVLDARGYLKVTDRKKDMYICGGFNCYPAEIEKVLSEHPGVEIAAVIGVPDERMGEVGRAFIVLRPGAQLTETELLAWAREIMANYKAPRSIRIVPDLPRNPAGKVLKTRLRDHA